MHLAIGTTWHDLHGTLKTALHCVPCTGRICTNGMQSGRTKKGPAVASGRSSTASRATTPASRRCPGFSNLSAFSGRFSTLPRHGADMIAIDGKALRRSLKAALNRSPLHVVNAVAAKVRQALRRVRAAGKSNEIMAMPGPFDVEGSSVTADAMHMRWMTAGDIAKKGGNFVLSPTRSPETFHDDARPQVADHEGAGKMLRCNAVSKSRGRIKIRDATTCHDATRCSGPATPAGPSGHRKGQGDSGDEKGHGARSRAASFPTKGSVRSGSSRCRARIWRQRIRFMGSSSRQFHWTPSSQGLADGLRDRTENGPGSLTLMRNLALNLARLDERRGVPSVC